MKDEQQFEQLIMQYKQLVNGSKDIKKLIESENFDEAITMIQTREPIMLNCKCMLRFLELSPEQQTELDTIVDELKTLEMTNIKILEKGMEQVQMELRQSRKNEKLQNAYNQVTTDSTGNIVNYQE